MSNTHKLFVAVDQVSKALDIYSLAMMHIKRLQRIRKEDLISQHGDYYNIPSDIRVNMKPPCVVSYDMDTLALVFGLGIGEERVMYMSHVCSTDYKEYHDGPKVVFNIGASGEHELIMNEMKKCLVQYGDVWECDESVSFEFKKVN